MRYAPREVMRIAGEAHLLLRERQGVVSDACFLTSVPIRPFEQFTIGKNPLFVIEAVMRICGICYASHATACAMAIERACGIVPPRNGVLMREVIGLLNRVQSHLVQLAMISPDLLANESAKVCVARLIDLHDAISECLVKIAGAATHTPLLTVGGILEAPQQKEFEAAIEQIDRAYKQWQELESILLDEDELSDVARILRDTSCEAHFFATHQYYGDPEVVRMDAVATMPYWRYRTSPEETVRNIEFSTAVYEERFVEVGPRARLSIFDGFRDDSLLGLHVARVREVGLALRRTARLLREVRGGEPFRAAAMVFQPGEGVGVHEAPRGTLIHHIRVGEEGRVCELRIIVPTMFNIPAMEKHLVGAPVNCAETVVRLYDPCVPCTTVHTSISPYPE